MSDLGCLLLIFIPIAPVVGCAMLHSAIAARISRAIAAPRCPACGYDEAGRDPAAPCPECGQTRPSAAAVFRDRPLLVLWPVLVPLLVAIPFAYFSVQFRSGERLWAIACLCGPFLWLAFTGLATRVHRRPRLALFTIALPTLLLIPAAAYTAIDLATPLKVTPGMDSYVPDLHRQLGPPVFTALSVVAIGILHILVATVIAVTTPRENRAT